MQSYTYIIMRFDEYDSVEFDQEIAICSYTHEQPAIEHAQTCNAFVTNARNNQATFSPPLDPSLTEDIFRGYENISYRVLKVPLITNITCPSCITEEEAESYYTYQPDS